MSYDKFLKDDVIYREGDPPDTIYFLLQGDLAYMNEQGEKDLLIKSGDVFGE